MQAAEQGSPPGLQVTARYNLGQALLWLGRFEDAAFHFERSSRLSRRAGLQRTAPGLLGVAEVNRALGRREAARMGYEEAAELAAAEGEAQLLVPALAGLARLLADGPVADPDASPGAAQRAEADRAEARRAAARAEAAATPVLLPRRWSRTAGWRWRW